MKRRLKAMSLLKLSNQLNGPECKRSSLLVLYDNIVEHLKDFDWKLREKNSRFKLKTASSSRPLHILVTRSPGDRNQDEKESSLGRSSSPFLVQSIEKIRTLQRVDSLVPERSLNGSSWFEFFRIQSLKVKNRTPLDISGHFPRKTVDNSAPFQETAWMAWLDFFLDNRPKKVDYMAEHEKKCVTGISLTEIWRADLAWSCLLKVYQCWRLFEHFGPISLLDKKFILLVRAIAQEHIIYGQGTVHRNRPRRDTSKQRK